VLFLRRIHQTYRTTVPSNKHYQKVSVVSPPCRRTIVSTYDDTVKLMSVRCVLYRYVQPWFNLLILYVHTCVFARQVRTSVMDLETRTCTDLGLPVRILNIHVLLESILSPRSVSLSTGRRLPVSTDSLVISKSQVLRTVLRSICLLLSHRRSLVASPCYSLCPYSMHTLEYRRAIAVE
jgi:hypothetical protein